MRPLPTLTGVPAALLLAILPLAPLPGQEDDAMKQTSTPSAEGQLTGAENHQASGTVHILDAEGKRQVHFTPDFSVERGPDVYVTLANGTKPVEGASVVVAKLTRFSGEQSFELPATVELGKYSHLVLWCKKYSVAMAVAKLTFPDSGMDEMKREMKEKGEMMKGKGEMVEKDETGKP